MKRHLPSIDFYVDSASFTDVAEIGDETIADIDRATQTRLHEGKPGGDTGNGAAMEGKERIILGVSGSRLQQAQPGG